MPIPFARIRFGAIKVPLPNVQQLDDFTCGAAAFQAVCCYFGVGPDDPDEFVKILHTSQKAGTKPEEIISWATNFGLCAEAVVDMSIDDLKRHLDAGQPVICSMQAYGPTSKRRTEYTVRKKGHYLDLDGHYIVAIGYDDKNFYFEDPSLAGRRGFIPIEEFDKRWHEDDSGHKVHLGLVISVDEPEDPAFLRKAKYIP